MKNSTFIINDLAFEISSLATKAIIYEASCFPSPGLVSPVSNGAHKDMDYYTFIDSTCAIMKYLSLFAQAGIECSNSNILFQNVREIGKRAEKSMFDKTNGVNTHKGMLFLMGITCAAVGKTIAKKKEFNEISNVIKLMTEGIVKKELRSLVSKKNLSNGEKLFLKYGIQGVRGEVEKGLPTVFNFALDFYLKNEDLDLNSRLIHTLLGIMQSCDDTNIVHRHDLKTLDFVKKKAIQIINVGGMRTQEGRKKINNLCNEFIEKNISPGGSADLLGVTVFLAMVKEYMSS